MCLFAILSRGEDIFWFAKRFEGSDVTEGFRSNDPWQHIVDPEVYE